MDFNVKEGKVYISHHKFGKKLKWKKGWLVLYGASQSGVARLELLDCSGVEERLIPRRPDKKILRLSDCVSVRAAHAEPCPGDGMEAFVVETMDRTYTFATDQQASRDWVQKLCLIAFAGVSRQDFSIPQPIQMAENMIYTSLEEVNDFWVSVRPSEASERCSLRGAYWLRVTQDSLILLEPETKETLLRWSYKLLRRYGNDKEAFSIEAGRRCESGPGKFSFETQQSTEVFSLMEAQIQKQIRSSECHGDDPLEGEGEGGAPKHQPRSPLPPTPMSTALMEQTSLYADPANSLGTTAVACCHGDRPEPVYSDVYDQVDGALVLKGGEGGMDSWHTEDRSTQLYSRVMKHTPSVSSTVSNVISDSLGKI